MLRFVTVRLGPQSAKVSTISTGRWRVFLTQPSVASLRPISRGASAGSGHAYSGAEGIGKLTRGLLSMKAQAAAGDLPNVVSAGSLARVLDGTTGHPASRRFSSRRRRVAPMIRFREGTWASLKEQSSR